MEACLPRLRDRHADTSLSCFTSSGTNINSNLKYPSASRGGKSGSPRGERPHRCSVYGDVLVQRGQRCFQMTVREKQRALPVVTRQHLGIGGFLTLIHLPLGKLCCLRGPQGSFLPVGWDGLNPLKTSGVPPFLQATPWPHEHVPVPTPSDRLHVPGLSRRAALRAHSVLSQTNPFTLFLQ